MKKLDQRCYAQRELDKKVKASGRVALRVAKDRLEQDFEQECGFCYLDCPPLVKSPFLKILTRLVQAYINTGDFETYSREVCEWRLSLTKFLQKHELISYDL